MIEVIPTNAYSWSSIGERWASVSEYTSWEPNVFYPSNQWLLQMPAVELSADSISYITLNVTLDLPSYAVIGNHTFVVGFSTNVSTPGQTFECVVYIDASTKKIKLNVKPTVSTSGVWYIYLYDGGYANGYLHSVEIGSFTRSSRVKMYTSSEWKDCVVKYWNGTNWVNCDIKYIENS